MVKIPPRKVYLILYINVWKYRIYISTDLHQIVEEKRRSLCSNLKIDDFYYIKSYSLKIQYKCENLLYDIIQEFIIDFIKDYLMNIVEVQALLI